MSLRDALLAGFLLVIFIIFVKFAAPMIGPIGGP